MKKIHITLVGGQPIPVYLGIASQECDEVVLVHSDTTLDEAQRIEKNCDKACVFVPCPPNDIAEIQATAKRLKEEFEACEVVLNITSGTKLWSIIFNQVFANHAQTKSIYVDQLNTVYDINTNEQHTLSMDMHKRFELYGSPLVNFTPLAFYTEKDYEGAVQIEKVRKINIGAFTELTNNERGVYDKNEGLVLSKNGSSMEWNWDEGWVAFDIIGYSGYPNFMRIEMDHPQEIVLNTSWFELKTAFELKKNPAVKGIYLNCEFRSAINQPKNEIDIIADFGMRLLFVECKTMIREITDIDKFRSAVRNYSGTSSTALFVTNDRTKGMRHEKYLSAMEKCKDNDILTFNFSLWDKKPETSMNAIVNKYLQKINKR
ncbi:MAG: DUF1887 family protein [Bacteroidaceae bacterium]|nr:DUF1887 family protein [Bacteroidaceae bacterium]